MSNSLGKNNKNNKTNKVNNSKSTSKTYYYTTNNSLGNVSTTSSINSNSSISNVATTASTNYTLTSTPVTATSSNYLNWSTSASPNYITYSYADFRPVSTFATEILETLNEEELSDLLDKVRERCNNEDVFKIIAKEVFQDSTRIYTEDMLMKYFDVLDKNALKTKYTPYIKSRQYPRLALYYETAE